jgi:hypothetical protein
MTNRTFTLAEIEKEIDELVSHQTLRLLNATLFQRKLQDLDATRPYDEQGVVWGQIEHCLWRHEQAKAQIEVLEWLKNKLKKSGGEE